MNTKNKKPSIALRHDLDLILKAAIMGSTILEEYVTVDASKSGISIRPLDKPIPFQVGTIVDLEIPISDMVTSTKNIHFLGKVVRVEKDLTNYREGKNLVGIRLIPIKNNDTEIWNAIFDLITQNKTTAGEGTSPIDSFEFTQKQVA
jgi:hypothetical protein